MKNFLKVIFALLGTFLPLHGGMSVFLPDEFRWWKEAFLVILLIIVVGYEINNAKKLLKKKSANFLKAFCKDWSLSEKFAKIFIAWCLVVWLFAVDKGTGLEAVRYLALPFLAFLIISRLLRHAPKKDQRTPTYFDHFAHFFVFGCILSLAFGTWVKFGNGLDFVQNFYSNTISSWVPGQTLPLWHETGGFVRMQGLSSGPIEFSHLLLMAFALTPYLWFRKNSRIFLGLVLLFGIWQSYSRSATLGALIIFVTYLFTSGQYQVIFRKKASLMFIGMVILFGTILLSKNNNFIHRLSTSDHFTRPVEAVQIGLESPFLGNLGELGPAARAKNLREKNNDQAPIAENIFADYFAQLGMLGLIFSLGFWWTLWKKIPKIFGGFFIAFFIGVNLATIFDMTPISLSFGFLFAFLANLTTNNPKLKGQL